MGGGGGGGGGGGLSYSRLHEILLEKIKAMGWDPSQFQWVGTHPSSGCIVLRQAVPLNALCFLCNYVRCRAQPALH